MEQDNSPFEDVEQEISPTEIREESFSCTSPFPDSPAHFPHAEPSLRTPTSPPTPLSPREMDIETPPDCSREPSPLLTPTFPPLRTSRSFSDEENRTSRQEPHASLPSTPSSGQGSLDSNQTPPATLPDLSTSPTSTPFDPPPDVLLSQGLSAPQIIALTRSHTRNDLRSGDRLWSFLNLLNRSFTRSNTPARAVPSSACAAGLCFDPALHYIAYRDQTHTYTPAGSTLEQISGYVICERIQPIAIEGRLAIFPYEVDKEAMDWFIALSTSLSSSLPPSSSARPSSTTTTGLPPSPSSSSSSLTPSVQSRSSSPLTPTTPLSPVPRTPLSTSSPSPAPGAVVPTPATLRSSVLVPVLKRPGTWYSVL